MGARLRQPLPVATRDCPAPGASGTGFLLPAVLLSGLLLACACTPVKQPPAAAVAEEMVIVRSDDPMAYRFDMQQDGRRMSADEFDAWMRARGIRIARGVPDTAADPER